MRICIIKKCNKKQRIKGYCNKHYQNFYRTGNPLGKFNGDKKAQFKTLHKTTRKAFFCKIKGCGKKHFARGWCHAHYGRFLRAGNPLGNKHNCLIKNCRIKVFKIYCEKHLYRTRKNLPLDLRKDLRIVHMRGENNPNWKGGVADYPNHSFMKKQRLIILMDNPKCEYCDNQATQIHHKDESKTNHKLSNLAAICHICNIRLGGRFYKKYGLTLKQIAEFLGKSTAYWYNHQNKISYYLEKI